MKGKFHHAFIALALLALPICPNSAAQLVLTADQRYVNAGQITVTASVGENFLAAPFYSYNPGQDEEVASQGSEFLTNEIHGTGSALISGPEVSAESYLYLAFTTTEKVKYNYTSSSSGSGWPPGAVGVEATIAGAPPPEGGPYSSLGSHGMLASGSGILFPGIPYSILVQGLPISNTSIHWDFDLTVFPLTKIDRFNQATVDHYNNVGDGMGAMTVVLGAAATIGGALLTDGASLFITGLCAGAGGVTGLTSIYAFRLARDPSDPNFTSIAQPILPAVAPVTTGGIITQAEANACNTWITNLVQQYGYSQTLYTCINRAQGASDAGSTYWETAQMNAAVQYEAQLAGFLDQEPVLRSNVVAALVAGGFPSMTVTVDDVISFQTNILAEGLPANLLNVLTQLGADSAAITNVQDSYIVADPNSVAGTFPQSLINTNLDSAEQALAADLRSSSLVLLNNALLPGGQFRFDLPTEPGYNYTIQFNSNLANPTGWTLLMTTNATASLISFTNAPPVASQAGFYRVSLN